MFVAASAELPGVKKTIGKLAEINDYIERAVQTKMAEGREGLTTYNDCLFAVAKQQPDLFLTRARLQVTDPSQSVYFDRSPSGQLINPCVYQGGMLVPLDSPLDTRPVDVNLTPDQELALRVASKMTKVAASDGPKFTYREALLLVASENPNLRRRLNARRY
jgi:hypothetical protein